jgi:RNase adapter protein RapZ
MKKVISFGYKHRFAKFVEADEIHDVRGFPNPYNVRSMQHLTGRSARVRKFVLSNPAVQKFIDGIISRNPSVVAVGCYGGKHRSVAIAEELGRRTGAVICHLELGD